MAETMAAPPDRPGQGGWRAKVFRMQNVILRLVIRTHIAWTLTFLAFPLLGPSPAAGGILITAALAVAVMSHVIRRRPYVPFIIGGTLLSAGIAMLLIVIATGAVWPATQFNVPIEPLQQGGSRPGTRPLIIEDLYAAGGSRFLLSLACAGFTMQAGVFLLLSGVNKRFLPRDMRVLGTVDILGPFTFLIGMLLPLIPLILAFVPLNYGLLNKMPPSNVLAALASGAWRFSAAGAVFMTTVGAFLVAGTIWWLLNAIEMREEAWRAGRR